MMKQAMIFAAGLGTRLKPLTDHMPKALVEVDGQPLLERVIKRLADANFDHLVVNVHHFSGQIIDFLRDHDNFGLDIQVSDETDALLDTGGGIRKAQQLFDLRYPILIHNVDILSNLDLDRFYRLNDKTMCCDCGVPHVRIGARLLVSWRKTKRYLVFNDQMRLVGWVNLSTGEVKSPFAEVRTALEQQQYPMDATDELMVIADHYHLFAFSGIHTFYPCLFSLMADYPSKFSIVDFYLGQCGKLPIVGYNKTDLKLMDVGKLDTLHDAEHFLQELDEAQTCSSGNQ